MNILIFIGVAVASYYLMSIVQTVLHRDYGHKKRIRAVFHAHAIGHHGIYNKNNLQTEKFEDCESHALNYYGIPIVAFAALIYFFFGLLVMVSHQSNTDAQNQGEHHTQDNKRENGFPSHDFIPFSFGVKLWAEMKNLSPLL